MARPNGLAAGERERERKADTQKDPGEGKSGKDGQADQHTDGQREREGGGEIR